MLTYSAYMFMLTSIPPTCGSYFMEQNALLLAFGSFFSLWNRNFILCWDVVLPPCILMNIIFSVQWNNIGYCQFLLLFSRLDFWLQLTAQLSRYFERISLLWHIKLLNFQNFTLNLVFMWNLWNFTLDLISMWNLWNLLFSPANITAFVSLICYLILELAVIAISVVNNANLPLNIKISGFDKLNIEFFY